MARLVSRTEMVESLLTEVRYALRTLGRAPTYAAGVALTIGLGLGVVGSAFTVVNAYLLRPVEVGSPATLVAVSWDTSTVRGQRLTLDDVDDLRRGLPAITAVAAVEEVLVTDGDRTTAGLLVTDDYFTVVAPRMVAGRGLRPGDAVGRARVVVLAERTWRARYGADPTIVGRTITLGDTPFVVVGVMRSGATLTGQEQVAFWAPLGTAETFASVDPQRDRAAASLSALVRARPGITPSAVRSAFEGWLRARVQPGSDNYPVRVVAQSRATRFPLDGPMSTLAMLILAAFALVLLVACANVTNLMMARALARQQQIAVRLALGATRAVIVRQHIVESLVLAGPAAAWGLALTIAMTRASQAVILRTFPAGTLPIDAALAPLEIDGRVLAIIAAAALAAAIAISVTPALWMLQTDLVRASRGEASFDARRSRLRTALVAAQIAAAVLFLVGAGSLLRETGRLASVDPGMQYDRVMTLRVDARLRTSMIDRLASDRSIHSVAAAWKPPMIGGALPVMTVTAGPTAMTKTVGFTGVSPDYFRMFDVPIVAGRTFTRLEAEDNAPVAVVSAATAQALWPDAKAVGQTLELRTPAAVGAQRSGHRAVSIIGIVADATNGNLLDGRDTTCVYFPTDLNALSGLLLVRGRSDTASLRATITRAAAIDPNAAVQATALRELVAVLIWIFAAFSTTGAVLGGIGLLLACAGTYAVVSFLVTLRAREFGVRMALGASAAQVLSGVAREQLRTVGAGVGAGLVVVFTLSRLLGSVVRFIPAFDLMPYAVGGLAVGLATMVAALIASFRAAHADPAQALRAE
jgi:predicted permease